MLYNLSQLKISVYVLKTLASKIIYPIKFPPLDIFQFAVICFVGSIELVLKLNKLFK